jgi:hypothetical protein
MATEKYLQEDDPMLIENDEPVKKGKRKRGKEEADTDETASKKTPPKKKIRGGSKVLAQCPECSKSLGTRPTSLFCACVETVANCSKVRCVHVSTGMKCVVYLR